tara:strand:+ start:10945 stop:11436 length:492 start_codon:yes stop_codon:yes gene_type:complete
MIQDGRNFQHSVDPGQYAQAVFGLDKPKDLIPHHISVVAKQKNDNSYVIQIRLREIDEADGQWTITTRAEVDIPDKNHSIRPIKTKFRFIGQDWILWAEPVSYFSQFAKLKTKYRQLEATVRQVPTVRGGADSGGADGGGADGGGADDQPALWTGSNIKLSFT